MNENLMKKIEFVTTIEKMKTIERRTKIIGVDRRENDAEHSFSIATMGIIFQDYAGDVDIDKCIKMLLVHDLVEIDAGDTFAYDTEGYKDKAEREQKAAERIYGILPGDLSEDLKKLWIEFDECKTPEAKYANAMDRLQPVINNIYNNGGTWLEYEVSWDSFLKRMEPIKEFNDEIFRKEFVSIKCISRQNRCRYSN